MFLGDPQLGPALKMTRRQLRRTTKILQRNAILLADVMPPQIIFDTLALLRDENLVWNELEDVRKPLATLIEAIMVYPLLRPELAVFCQSMFANVDSPSED